MAVCGPGAWAPGPPGTEYTLRILAPVSRLGLRHGHGPDILRANLTYAGRSAAAGGPQIIWLPPCPAAAARRRGGALLLLMPPFPRLYGARGPWGPSNVLVARTGRSRRFLGVGRIASTTAVGLATLLNIAPLDPKKNRDAHRLKRNRTCAARAPACDCRRSSSMDKVPTFQFQVPPASEDRNAKGSLAGMGADGLLDTQKEVRATEAPQWAPRPLARPMQCP